jgi:adenylate cyclase
MGFRDRPLAVWGLPLVALFVALFTLGMDTAGVATYLRGYLFDTYAKINPRPYEDTKSTGHPVRVLEIDPASLARFGAWPWSHTNLANLVDGLKRQGAEIVVLVGRIDRPDPLSSGSLVSLVPQGAAFDATREALRKLPSPDTALSKAFASVKTVSGFSLGEGGPLPALKAGIGWSGAYDPFEHQLVFQKATGSLPDLEAASAGLGALTLKPAFDGRVRRMPLAFRLKDKTVPSLDAEVLRLAEDKSQLIFKSDDGNSGLIGGPAGVSALEANAGALPTAPDGSIWLYLSDKNPTRMVTASAVLDGRLPPDALHNAIVYIGDPAETVLTANGPRPIAEVHAEAMENLLLGTVLRRPAAAIQGELACLALLGLACVFLIGRRGIGITALFVIVVSLAIGYGTWRIYVSEHVLFDGLSIGAGLTLVWVSGALARVAEFLRTRLTLRSAFTGVLPRETIHKIAIQRHPMRLDGQTRTITYMSCGIRGFAELASSFRGDPTALTRLVQRVLDPLMAQVLSHNGAIGKLTADGFTAFWNAPLDDAEHAVHACEVAAIMMEVIAQTNEIITHERRIDGVALDPVEIGVGISSGPAIAGGFKVHGRTAYSVNGDCVLMAERIQRLSANYGPAVVVSEETRKLSERGFAFLEVDYIVPEGLEDPVKLYAMLGNPVMRASPKFRALATFHDHIFQSMRDQQWNKARALIAQCRKLSGASQKLYDLLLARIDYFQSKPPEADWDGAFRQGLG